MATLDVDARREVAKKILRYCGVPAKDLNQKLTSWWFRNGINGGPNTEERLINDAIHGPVELSPLLYQIINTREFHRLKEIKQLGAANYVYPGANHTRFDHSIGVCYLAGEFAHSLKRKIEEDAKYVPDDEKRLWTFTEEEVVCTQVAGLCHDLGHGPFSHMFEHMIIQSPTLGVPRIKHEELSIAIFKHLLVENLKVLYEFVKANLSVEHVKKIEKMIHPPTRCMDSETTNGFPDKRLFLYEIVANKQSGVDVDKWDYYTRDCYYLGVSHDFQWRRCMLLCRVINDNGELHIAFRDKELDNLYGMFRIRCHLHQIAYQHKTSKAVERMLSDAILLAKDMPIIGTSSQKVMDLRTTLLEAIEYVKNGRDGSKLEGYLKLTDSLVCVIKNALYREVHKSTVSSTAHREAIKLLERVEERDLYYLSARTRIPVFNMDTHVLKELEDEQALLNNILCHLPSEIKFRKEDLWIQIVKFKLASELKDDPVKEVLFYEKESKRSPIPLRQLSLIMASQLLVPKTFVEYEVRIYDKRLASARGFEDSKSLQKALNEWRKTVTVPNAND